MQKSIDEKIVCIFTNPEVYQLCLSLKEEMQIGWKVFFSPMENAVALGRQVQKEGAELIISRGGVSVSLQQAVDIPVISLKYTFLDFASALEKARKISDKIAIVSYASGYTYAQQFAQFFGMTIPLAQITDSHSVLEVVREQKENGIEVIVGGYSSIRAARQLGMASVPMGCNRESILEALEQARKTLTILYEQKSRLETVTAVLSTATTGMLVVDPSGKVTHINSLAQSVLGAGEAETVGTSYRTAFPYPQLVEQSLKGEAVRQRVISHNKRFIIVDCIPIRVKEQIIGSVISIQEGDEIRNMDNKLRIKALGDGHIAKNRFNDILGNSRVIQTAKQKAQTYAAVDSAVMLYGESGTGKELFAQSIHNASPRRKYPFVAINCAALPETLLESELFGYSKGAFTGARSEGKAGIFELAQKGTIFLDEIGEMPLALQSRLLRVLQEKEVVRLGDTRVIPVDVRILAATNRNLLEEVRKGNFRKDLYYRLCVLILTVPPLRERKEDIGFLAAHFAREYAGRYGKIADSLTPEALELLQGMDFPGNVRELSSLMERTVILTEGDSIGPNDINNAKREEFPVYEPETVPDRIQRGRPAVKRAETEERERILQALEEAGGQKEAAAELLGISRATLWRKMKKMGLE